MTTHQHSDAHADTLVDVRDMIVVHTALRREFRLAPVAVGRVRTGDTAQASTVDTHLAFLCGLLHHHHQGEDELLWPLLRERVPEAALRSVDEVESQHIAIDGALLAVATARDSWRPDPNAAHRDALMAALQHLHELLDAHLDLEEGVVLPLAAGVLTTAEWNAIGEAAAASMSKPELITAFGMFAYEGDPAVLKAMLASAPAVPRFVVPRVAPRVYARLARRVYGTSTP